MNDSKKEISQILDRNIHKDFLETLENALNLKEGDTEAILDNAILAKHQLNEYLKTLQGALNERNLRKVEEGINAAMLNLRNVISMTIDTILNSTSNPVRLNSLFNYEKNFMENLNKSSTFSSHFSSSSSTSISFHFPTIELDEKKKNYPPSLGAPISNSRLDEKKGVASTPIVNAVKQMPVPNDGDCLFCSCVLGVLVELAGDKEKFEQMYNKIFVAGDPLKYSIRRNSGNPIVVDNAQFRQHVRQRLMELDLNDPEGVKKLYELYFFLQPLFTRVLRNRIADYIERNNLAVPGTPEKSRASYLEDLRNTLWGGDVELNAFCLMAGVRGELTWPNGRKTTFGKSESETVLKIFNVELAPQKNEEGGTGHHFVYGLTQKIQTSATEEKQKKEKKDEKEKVISQGRSKADNILPANTPYQDMPSLEAVVDNDLDEEDEENEELQKAIALSLNPAAATETGDTIPENTQITGSDGAGLLAANARFLSHPNSPPENLNSNPPSNNSENNDSSGDKPMINDKSF